MELAFFTLGVAPDWRQNQCTRRALLQGFAGPSTGSELESLLFTPARHAKTRTNVVANARNSYGYCCALRLVAARFDAPLGRAQKTLKLSEVESFSFSDERTVFVGCWIDSADETLIFDFDERDQRVNTA